MKLRIVSMEIDDFKGIRHLEIDFSKKTIIKGQNASGKSTIASAITWVFGDKDINLVSNPPIKPLNVEECSPTVSINIDADGRKCQLTKKQTIKHSKPNEDGIVKTSLSNSYEWNSVPLTERDFKAHLEELGITSTDILMMLMHTEIFTSMKTADMRKVLFEMVNEHSDLEIAEKMGNIPDVVALLDTYKVAEIEAMNKASIKKCKEQVENIPSIIEGLEKAKVDVDVAELELLKASLESQISSEENKLSLLEEQKANNVHLMTESMRIEFEIGEEKKHLNESNNNVFDELKKKADGFHDAFVNAQMSANKLNADVSMQEKIIDRLTSEFNDLKAEYTSAKESKFDTSKNVCPCCGQNLPNNKIEDMLKSFEAEKKARMDKANRRAKEVKTSIDETTSMIETLKANAKSSLGTVEIAEKKYLEAKKELDEFKPIEVVTSPKLEELENKLAEIKNTILANDVVEPDIINVKGNIGELRSQLNDVIKKISLSENNIKIDEQIADLSTKRLTYEQNKADSEKILYQLELLSRAKNEQLADDINSHFSLVKFEFFEYLKNGNYKECCKAFVDGKELGIATNTALELEAKIDICRGLQKFYGIDSFIVVDNAECLDSSNLEAFNLDTQLIFLKVSDDKGLVIE